MNVHGSRTRLSGTEKLADSAMDGPIRILAPTGPSVTAPTYNHHLEPPSLARPSLMNARPVSPSPRRAGRWHSDMPEYETDPFAAPLDVKSLTDQAGHRLDERDKPPRLESRQLSNSSDEAVAPIMSTRIVNDTVPKRRSSVRTVVFENVTAGTFDEQPPPPQGRSKNVGLTYALRRTDSGSTFQSLDGLGNAYPLIRKEARRRKERSSSSRDKRRHKKRTSHRSSRQSRPSATAPGSYFFDASTISCFPTTAWFPVDKSTMGSKRSPSMSHLQYQEQRTKLKPDKSQQQLSTRDELLRLKLQLRELRRKANPHEAEVPRRSKHVRFVAPLVTQITYRPYTDPQDIALLYFQEEELEALECDREEVSGDQFECQFDETVMTVRIAYQKRNPADE